MTAPAPGPARPLYFLGECPPIKLADYAVKGLKHEPLFPFPKGSAGGRLWALTDWGMGEYIKGTRRYNIVPDFPGSAWPGREARANAEKWREVFIAEGAIAVLVGRRVADAFRLPATDAWFTEYEWPHWLEGHQGATVHVIPHTSGRNRIWNDSFVIGSASLLFAKLRPHATAARDAWAVSAGHR